jgi:uncharacterized protein (TIGR03086 family)
LADLNRRAVEHSIEIVAAVTADDLALTTPCAGWTLGDLLAHMIAQHDGFAAAAKGNSTDRSVWEWRPLSDDPAADYASAARHVIAAFAADGLLDRTLWLPEIRDGGPFPAAMAIGFHLLDYVVHGWDVAASLGIDVNCPPDLVAAALVISEQVPTGPARTAFGPPLASTAPAPMDHLLEVLGLSPTWSASGE